jgi:DNA phosphorothioation-dependent restriction protein DptG
MNEKLIQEFEALEEKDQAQLNELFDEMEANQLASEKLAQQVVENRKEYIGIVERMSSIIPNIEQMVQS